MALKNSAHIFLFLLKAIEISLILFCISFTCLQCYTCVVEYQLEKISSYQELTSINDTVPVEITVCADQKDAYNLTALKLNGIENYDTHWYGNKNTKTGNEIFNEVSYDLEKLIYEKVEVRTSSKTWWFNPKYYQEKNKEKQNYDGDISSPFRIIRNFYGGKCFGFLPPDFLWNEGVRRIGIFLRKPSFVRLIHKGQRRHIDSSAEIYIQLNSTIYAEVSQTIIESIRVAGKPCNNSINFSFDKIAMKYLSDEMNKKFGCTSPWAYIEGSDHKICKDQALAREAMSMERVYNSGFDDSYFGSPCSSMNVQFGSMATTENKRNSAYLALNFKKSVMVVKSMIPYDFLSMIAEMGGYVGLFLGISVQQVARLPYKFLKTTVEAIPKIETIS